MACFSLYAKTNAINNRAWSRFQNRCITPELNITSIDIYDNNNIVSKEVKYNLPSYVKGNILQYKKNSSNLTKNQRYAQIAKGAWTNRTKTWASQGNGFIKSDPNSGWLKREGNILICNIIEDPYTGVVLNKTFNQECNSSKSSDVPGKDALLCWNDGLQTY